MKETKFKQTEVGLIPNDWEVRPLNSVVDFYNGDRGVNYPKDSDFCNVGIPFINAGHLKKNQIDFSSMDYITKAHYKRLGGAKIKKDDILFCLRGSLGKYAYVNFDDAAPASSLCVLRSKKIEPKYLFQLLGSEYVKKQIVDANSGSSQPNLSARDVGNFNVVCPSTIEEQKRIAQALSDVDAVITTTEKIIAKKKALKQGAMQTLLSGKMRIQNGKWIKTTNFKQTELGPIPQEWDVKNLGEIAETFTGLTYSPDNVFKYGTLVLRSSNIQDGKLCFEDNVYVQMPIPQRAMVQENDILICVRNGSKALIGKSAFITKKAVGMAFGAFMTVLRTNVVSPQFLLYAWQSDSVQKQVADNLGATINQITNADFKNFWVIIPPAIEEQTAIATVLSDMDTEIAALETKLAKYRQLKTGMMQQLLTGKIRLV